MPYKCKAVGSGKMPHEWGHSIVLVDYSHGVHVLDFWSFDIRIYFMWFSVNFFFFKDQCFILVSVCVGMGVLPEHSCTCNTQTRRNKNRLIICLGMILIARVFSVTVLRTRQSYGVEAWGTFLTAGRLMMTLVITFPAELQWDIFRNIHSQGALEWKQPWEVLW